MVENPLSYRHGETEDFITENRQILSNHLYSNMLPLKYSLNKICIVLFSNGIKNGCDLFVFASIHRWLYGKGEGDPIF